MRIVAIGATYRFVIHLALHERAVHVHLVEDLAIRVIQAGLQGERFEVIQQGTTMRIIRADTVTA